MLKPIARDQSVAVISLADTAVDVDASDKSTTPGRDKVLAYAEQRYQDPSSWRRTVKLVDGRQPTVFTIGIVPSSELSRIDDDCTDDKFSAAHKMNERGWRCFLRGVRSIDNIDVGKDKIPTVKVDGVEYVDPDWLRTTFVGPLRNVAVEVGLVIWNWNRLGDGDSKN